MGISVRHLRVATPGCSGCLKKVFVGEVTAASNRAWLDGKIMAFITPDRNDPTLSQLLIAKRKAVKGQLLISVAPVVAKQDTAMIMHWLCKI